MKIHYRIQGKEIEIVRCFGTDRSVRVPEVIDGMPVTKVSA